MIDLDRIHKGMDVMTSDGQKLGTVRELLGHVMFLDEAVSASGAGGVSIPLTWIVAVDEVVHLAKSRDQAERDGQAGSQVQV